MSVNARNEVKGLISLNVEAASFEGSKTRFSTPGEGRRRRSRRTKNTPQSERKMFLITGSSRRRAKVEQIIRNVDGGAVKN